MRFWRERALKAEMKMLIVGGGREHALIDLTT
jgi:hypothetical protein